MAELAVLVPVLGRPHRVQPFLDSLRAATPDHRVLFICDPDDSPMIAAVAAADEDWIEVSDNYAAKINAGIEETDEPFIFCGADDLDFHPGWFETARDLLELPVGVVSTNDLCNARNAKGNLATHPLVARWYVEEQGTVDEPGKLMHEGYPHEYVDRELTETAQHRGAFAHCPESVVEHLHPMAGKAPMDALYAAQKERMRAGYRIYKARRPLWT